MLNFVFIIVVLSISTSSVLTSKLPPEDASIVSLSRENKSTFNVNMNGNEFDSLKQHNDYYDDLKRPIRLIFKHLNLLFKNIKKVVNTTVPKVSAEIEGLLEKLQDINAELLETFGNKVMNLSKTLFIKVLENTVEKLERIQRGLLDIASNTDQYLEWAITQLNQTLINNTAEFDWWIVQIKQKVRSVNKTTLYKDGCRTFDEFIANSAKELQKCCQLNLKSNSLLCKTTSELFTQALHVAMNIVDQMQACIEDRSSYFEYLIPCISLLHNDISALVSQVEQISQQMNGIIPIKIIYTNDCIALVLIDMNEPS
uniref:Protein TsetseEP domain-containing protein n=1 Tax=Glossina palpalis gambiensis TaxID=67801 RepID=A0A1B0B9L5_9MUSC